MVRQSWLEQWHGSSYRFTTRSTPATTIKRRKFLADREELRTAIASRNVRGIVLGLPRNLDGSEGPRAQSARALARNILSRRDLPISFQDERLSSAEAERAMIAGDLSRARRAELIDASAAAIILQTAIDRIANAS